MIRLIAFLLPRVVVVSALLVFSASGEAGSTTQGGTPTETPSSNTKRGDISCDGRIFPDDALILTVHAASMTAGSCIPVGGNIVAVGGGQYVWGDIDCDEDVDLDDAIALLAFLTGAPFAINASCPADGDLGDVVPYP
jgi:hypothetical protein